MTDKNCNTCHHLPELLWSHREARLRGFAIDQVKFDAWYAWAESRTKDISPGMEQAAFMLLAMPQQPPKDAIKLIQAGQQPDGAWKHAGQFVGQRREAAEVKANSARIFLLALATQADQTATAAARTKAAAIVGEQAPAKSIETPVFRLLYAQRFGTAAEVNAQRDEILTQQHADGGWAWAIGEPHSDALGTGQVLYALSHLADTATHAASVRAQQWLMSIQGADGSWLTDITRISKTDRSAPAKAKSLKDATAIYQYYGTAWATIGLLHGVPVTATTSN